MHSAAPPGPSGNDRWKTRATRAKSGCTIPRSIDSPIGPPRERLKLPASRIKRPTRGVCGGALVTSIALVAAVAPSHGEVGRERPLLRDRHRVAPIEDAAPER